MTPKEEAKALELAKSFIDGTWDGEDPNSDADIVAQALLAMRDQRDEALKQVQNARACNKVRRAQK